MFLLFFMPYLFLWTITQPQQNLQSPPFLYSQFCLPSPFLFHGISHPPLPQIKFSSTMAIQACSLQAALPPSLRQNNKHLTLNGRNSIRRNTGLLRDSRRRASKSGVTKCSRSFEDFIGGDLVKPDIGRWLSDVEEHKALAIYPPHEGGYEGRYLSRLERLGYRFLDLSARGLGDPETTLTKFHPVCPAHVGKQPIARWYFPPEVDYRLSLLPPNAKGLVVLIIEAKVLSKAELQFLAILPSLRPRVKIIAECGNWRKFMWKPLKEIAGLTATGEQVSSQ